jgi:predicted DNA-binding transcriptional regulator YafY
VWSVQDFDLWRWILGFGGEVRVVQPVALRETIAGMARAICGVYEGD